MAARGRELRGQRLHLPGVPAADAGRGVGAELQHEPQQVDDGQLRLQHHVVCIYCVVLFEFHFITQGDGPVQADPGPGGGPSLPSAQLLGVSHRL